MTYLSLSEFSGQFTPEVIRKIRRKIMGRLVESKTVIVLDGNAVGLTDEVRKAIQDGWPDTQVRFSNAHPSATRLSRARRRRPPL